MLRLVCMACFAVLAVGCVSAGPAATPIIIYITPPPAPVDRTPIPFAQPTPTTASSTLVGPTVRPTVRPTLRLPETGSWYVAPVTKDPLTDQSTMYIMVSAHSGKSEFGDSPALYIRCKDGNTEMYINWSTFIDTESALVTTRVGSAAASNQILSVSTDYESTFFFAPEDLIRSMFGQETFIAQVTPYSANAITASFDITGIENAIFEVRATCDW